MSKDDKLEVPVEHLKGILRVLKLVDGYMSTQDKDLLLGWDGGMMTWGELRKHVRAAKKLIKVKE